MPAPRLADRIWRTESGVHHVSAAQAAGAAMDLDLESTAFAPMWNEGWKGDPNLRGRLVIGFKLSSREAVDAVYADLAGAGHAGLQPPYGSILGLTIRRR
jgi:hypothetical protein